MNRIPLVDLAAQHAEVRDEVTPGIVDVMDHTAFIGGRDVAEFEREYAEFAGVGHVVGVGNGTDALELALRAVGVGAGDEVVLPANTFVATAEAVIRAGATPVLVDCDRDTYLIDTEQAVGAFGPRTKAVMPVHLYGQKAAVEDLVDAAASHGVTIVEDAAQSQGAKRHGEVGLTGRIAGTSFYPGKNLGAYGDAGAVLTDDPDLARAVRLLANHGSEVRYQHETLGFNSRLDGFQGVVLRAKLKRLAKWNQARRAAADRYGDLLSGTGTVVLPQTLEGNEHVWHLYVVRVPDRDRTVARLNEAGVGAAVHYPVPVHLHQAFASLGKGPGTFPVAEQVAGQILSLPLHPHLTAEDSERVVEALLAAL